MTFTLGLFFIFSFVLLSSALVVVSTRNMVHSVMFLILAFFNAAGLFILLGAEFLAMLLIVVYVGAIAVLFLFVVMMLNIDRNTVKNEIRKTAPILICSAIVLFCEIFLIIKASTNSPYHKIFLFPIQQGMNNVGIIGDVLYTDFFLPFQLAGGVLFVAMIGAIVLTLRQKDRFIRKQRIFDQVTRNKENSLEIVKVQVGQGIDL